MGVLEWAVDDVTAPLHALITVDCAVTGVDDHLCEVDQRVLHQVAQRVLHRQLTN